MRILLVDADTLTATTSQLALTVAGHDAHVVYSASAAKRMLKGGAFDAIVCDMRLPREDGFELRSGLLEDSESARIPFYFCTAGAGLEERELATKLSATGVLAKPLAREEVEVISRGATPRPRSSQIVLIPPVSQDLAVGELPPGSVVEDRGATLVPGPAISLVSTEES